MEKITLNKNFDFFIFRCAPLCFQRTTTNSRLELLQDAFEDYSACLRIDERFVKALNGRAKVHMGLKQYEDCIIDCKESLEIEDSAEIEKLMKDAKYFLNKDQKQTTAYDTLKIPKNASHKDAKKAFKLLFIECNSKRRPDTTAVERRKIDYKIAQIIEAYKIITGSGKILNDVKIYPLYK